MSTSISYLRKRLRDIGRFDLLEGAERGDFSFHAASIAAGLIKQPANTGNGSQNRARSTAWALAKASRQSAPLNGSAAPTMPDLAAALGEVEKMHRKPRSSTHKVRAGNGLHRADPPDAGDRAEVTRLQGALDRAHADLARLREAATSDHCFVHPSIACTTCPSPCAPDAVRELLSAGLAARRGEQNLVGSTTPRACCKRQQLSVIDPRALIG